MVLFAKRDILNRQIVNKGKICKSTILGIISLIVPILTILLDPLHKLLHYNLRLSIGSILCSIIQNEIKAAEISIYIFNITNPERFLSGEDKKMRVEEIGPFVFQEYRWYEDLGVSEDGKTMGMTTKFRSEFISEKSFADPKDVTLTLLNLSLLNTASFISNYDVITKSIFSTLTYSMKPFMSLDVHSFLWGFDDPLVSTVNAIAPNLIYFKSLGIFDRLYDNQSDYRVDVSRNIEDKLQIKTVTKSRRTFEHNIHHLEVTKTNFTGVHAYEGIGYPPELTPEVPISLYRVGVCQIFDLEYIGRKTMEYGGEGFIYTISDHHFENGQNPITKKMYPKGLIDISSCYYGMPFTISRAHFVDADPILLDYVDGLKPDKDKYKIEFVIDRRVAVSYETQVALQVNLALGDLRYNRATKKLTDAIVPVLRADMDQPKMSPRIELAFYLVYSVLPYILLVIEIVLTIVGLVLISSAVKSMYINWHISTKGLPFEAAKNKKRLAETLSGVPLIRSEHIKISTGISKSSIYMETTRK